MSCIYSGCDCGLNCHKKEGAVRLYRFPNKGKDCGGDDSQPGTTAANGTPNEEEEMKSHHKKECPCLSLPILREMFAEGLGTFILMVFGMGSVAQFVLSKGQVGSSDQIRWSWGFGVAFGVFTSGGVTGGHLNPAVTLALCVIRKCKWRKLLPYILAQYLGSFLASLVVFIVYHDALDAFDGGNRSLETAGIFATYPQPYLSAWNGLGDQVFATAVLMFLILALTDKDNMAPSQGYLPLVIGLVVTTIGMTFGFNCGYAINPARDLGPRLFTLVAGWGTKVFSIKDYQYFWIPVIGPHLGAILGGFTYVCLIQMKSPFQVISRTKDNTHTPAIPCQEQSRRTAEDQPTNLAVSSSDPEAVAIQESETSHKEIQRL